MKPTSFTPFTLVVGWPSVAGFLYVSFLDQCSSGLKGFCKADVLSHRSLWLLVGPLLLVSCMFRFWINSEVEQKDFTKLMLRFLLQVDFPDIGIDLASWVTVITEQWFSIVAIVIGFVFIGGIVWKGVAMLKRDLLPTGDDNEVIERDGKFYTRKSFAKKIKRDGESREAMDWVREYRMRR